MTADEVTAFAARITTAIDGAAGWRGRDAHHDADRLRVASDLAGYLRALDGLAEHGRNPLSMACYGCQRASCRDRARYTDERDDRLAGLTRTGALYGVTL